MGNAAPQRVTVLARAKEAVELANDCLDQTKKLTSAIGGLERRRQHDNEQTACTLGDLSERLDRVDGAARNLELHVVPVVSGRVARFETMRFHDRFCWLLTGRTWAEQCARHEGD